VPFLAEFEPFSKKNELRFRKEQKVGPRVFLLPTRMRTKLKLVYLQFADFAPG
jgi:hypothetical protein